AAFEQEIVHGGLPGDLGSLSVRRGRAADLFGDRRVARSEHGRVRRVIDDRRAQRDHLAHALHAVGQHRHRLAVLASRLHQSVTVLVQDLALPRRTQHAEVLGQVRGPENGECSMSTRAKSRPAAWSRPASGPSPTCSSISAADSRVAVGLAMPRPAMSGAEPCTGSKYAQPSPKLPDGTSPSPPAVSDPRSDRMSPYWFMHSTT